VTHRVAFLVHPLDRSDLVRHDPWFERYDERELRLAAELCEPVFLGEARGLGERCALLGALLLPDQVLAQPSLAETRARAAVRQAAALGAHTIGLGALLGGVGDPIARDGVLRVTSGNALTAALAAWATAELVPASAPVTLVGATGSLGRLLTLALARAGHPLTLVGRRLASLTRLADELSARGHPAPRLSTDIVTAARESRLLVTAAGAATPYLAATELARDAVVLDLGVPDNVSHGDATSARVVKAYFEIGGGLELTFGLRLPPGLAFGCLTETLLLATAATTEALTGRAMTLELCDSLFQRALAAGCRPTLR
jgi:predicted amino acid dehydrogenase